MRPRVLHATWFSPDVGALGLRANIRSIGRAMWVGQLRAIEWDRAICHGLRGRQRVMAQAQALAGRVAIVTGAANGMGRVMARALAGAGAKVAGVDVDAGGLDRLAAEPVFAGKFLNAIANVSKSADSRHAVEQALGTFGALDILINCAGISMSTAAGHKAARIKFFEADPEGWRRIVAINAIGAFLMARFAAEPMIKRGWGRIINVTTSFDTMLAGGLSAYGASKAALEASCVSFAKDLEGTGVTVNILVPGGPTDTPVSSRPASRALTSCSTPKSWARRRFGSPRRNPTASAPAASSPATGTCACRRPRLRRGRARRRHGPRSRRAPAQPAAMRCNPCLELGAAYARSAASSTSPANRISPASRFDLNTTRQLMGSSTSRRAICHARCAAKARSPNAKTSPAPALQPANAISATASA